MVQPTYDDKLRNAKLETIIAYIQAGYAPSEIDKELKLTRGYTHDVWVSYWWSGDYGALLKPTSAPAITPRKHARKLQKPKRMNVRHTYNARAEACNV